MKSCVYLLITLSVGGDFVNVPVLLVVLFDIEAQSGGSHHRRLNICGISIVKKYREGNLKRTLRRELTELEIVRGEGFAVI